MCQLVGDCRKSKSNSRSLKSYAENTSMKVVMHKIGDLEEERGE
jgi:hypothetical protein